MKIAGKDIDGRMMRILAMAVLGVALLGFAAFRHLIPARPSLALSPAVVASAVKESNPIAKHYGEITGLAQDKCAAAMQDAVFPVSGIVFGCAKTGNPDALRRVAYILRYLEGKAQGADVILDSLIAKGDTAAAQAKKDVVDIPASPPIDHQDAINNASLAAGLAISCLATPEYPQCGAYPIPPDGGDDLAQSAQLRQAGRPMAAHIVAERAAMRGTGSANAILCHDYLYGDGVLLDYDAAAAYCTRAGDAKLTTEAEKLRKGIDEAVAKTKTDRKNLMNAAHYKYRQITHGCAIFRDDPACADPLNLPVPVAISPFPVEKWPFTDDGRIIDSAFVTPLLPTQSSRPSRP